MKKTILFLCIILLLTISLQALPLQAENKQEEAIVRVYLKRLNLTKYIDIDIAGNYVIEADNISMALKRNMQVKLRLVNNNFYIYCNGITTKLGNNIKFARKQLGSDTENGLRFNSLKNLYCGDLHLKIVEDNIFAILHIAVEDYLLGVVPYEMSDSFPLEALKAQAIAARTYAIKHLKPSEAFDLYDTSKDQVYKGFNEENSNSKSAVLETKNICAFIDNKLATCYYSASNGGQTDLPINKWGSKGDSDCYAMLDDEFDLKNAKSKVSSYILMKNLNSSEHNSAEELICKNLVDYASKSGFNTAAENLRLDKIISVKVDSPKFPKPSRVYSNLQIKLTFSGKKLLSTDIATNTPPPPTTTPFVYTFIKNLPTPSPQLNLSEFIPYGKEVVLNLPVFDDVRNSFSLALNGGGFELINVIEKSDSFVIEARRYGHGVGLSQRGAQQMAVEGKKYKEILDFYYPGIAVLDYIGRINIQNESDLHIIDPYLFSTAEPLPTGTPLPSPIPLLWKIPKEVEIVSVSNIEQDSYLNLRKGPSTSSEAIYKLFYGQQLLVVEYSENKEWVHVVINGKTEDEFIEGYVMAEYVVKNN